jgi:hypothetical protein
MNEKSFTTYLNIRIRTKALFGICLTTAIFVALSSSVAFAQNLEIDSPSRRNSDYGIWWQVILLAIGVAAAISLWRQRRNASNASETYLKYEPQQDQAGFARKPSASDPIHDNSKLLAKFDAVVKNNKESYERLPLFTIINITAPQPFELLPEYKDPILQAAIDHSNEEWEGDPAVREQALKILSGFRMQNAVDAIAQMALYDLSTNIRSQALLALSQFDHESVFETILLGCTDPSRSVRAAAARALFRLSFDRADAWLRIAESGDEISIRQAARAVVAADLVKRSLDRLIHPRRPHAMEGLAIVNLLIKAGETKELLAELVGGSNPNIALAILHVIDVTRDSATLAEIAVLRKTTGISDKLRASINKVLDKQDFAPTIPEPVPNLSATQHQ